MDWVCWIHGSICWDYCQTLLWWLFRCSRKVYFAAATVLLSPMLKPSNSNGCRRTSFNPLTPLNCLALLWSICALDIFYTFPNNINYSSKTGWHNLSVSTGQSRVINSKFGLRSSNLERFTFCSGFVLHSKDHFMVVQTRPWQPNTSPKTACASTIRPIIPLQMLL